MNKKNPKAIVVTIASLISITLLLTACEQSLSSDDYSLSITEPNLKAEAVVIKEVDDYFEDLYIHETDDNGNSENGEADEMTGINTSDTNAVANGNDTNHDINNDGKGGIKNPNLDFELNILAHMKDGFENELVKELLKEEIEEYEDLRKDVPILSEMGIIYYFVDLNGDGKEDLIVMYVGSSYFSGWGRYCFNVYINTDSQYELAISTQFRLFNLRYMFNFPDESDVFGSIHISPNTTNGYHDILITTDDYIVEEHTLVYRDGKYDKMHVIKSQQIKQLF
jgi:hypothetical protein